MIAARREGNLPGRTVRCGRYVAMGDGDACASDVIIANSEKEKERRLKNIQEMTSTENISRFIREGIIKRNEYE